MAMEHIPPETTTTTPAPLKPHVAVVPWPSQGHINPAMRFSTQLASQGFAVTFVNTQHNYQLLMSSRAQSDAPSPLDDLLDFRWIAIPDGLPPNQNRSIIDVCHELKNRDAEFFLQLVTQLKHQEPPLTCLIIDMFIPFAQDVANKLGVPRVAFWCQSIASFTCHLVFSNGFRPPTDGVSNLITCIPGSPPLQLNDIPRFLQSCDPSDLMFELSITPFQQIGNAACVLVNTFDELEEIGILALREQLQIYTLGPLLPSDFLGGSKNPLLQGKSIGSTLWPEEYDCLEWLDNHRPSSVLYVSFGSRVFLSSEQIRELAIGLETSKQPFLWVVRSNLVEGGSAILPDGFVDRVKDRALFISWAPQPQVLCHPSVGGFLTHCGWNSTLEGISAGVPMLGWPSHYSDQRLNRRFIVDEWHIGLKFEENGDGLVLKEEVEGKVRALMQGEEGREARHRATKLKNAARTSMHGGSSYMNFQTFINLIKRP